MKERVRALLVTDNQTVLLVKRTKPNITPYWIVPGGHVEAHDSNLESALRRELHEELSAKAEIIRLIFTLESPSDRQYFYLAKLKSWSFDDRTGEEFYNPTFGDYEPEFVPLTVEALKAIDLLPTEFTNFLLSKLPDIRSA